MSPFNSSLKDTTPPATVKVTETSFQFLIKGYSVGGFHAKPQSVSFNSSLKDTKCTHISICYIYTFNSSLKDTETTLEHTGNVYKTFNSSLKDTVKAGSRILAAFSFNSSLKDTITDGELIVTVVALFQFLIKGYKSDQSSTPSQQQNFQFLIKGYSLMALSKYHMVDTFNSSLKDTKPFAVMFFRRYPFNSSLKDTFCGSGVAKSRVHFQFLIKGYKKLGKRRPYS